MSKAKKAAATHIQCKCCKQPKPASNFLVLPNAKRFKIVFCNSCAHENMKRWARTQWVGRKVNMGDMLDEGD